MDPEMVPDMTADMEPEMVHEEEVARVSTEPHTPYWAHLPNPEQMRLERERFLLRPDTAMHDRQRREVGLREAAMSLRPPRDGYMVALQPVVSEPLQETEETKESA
jgi:hypothetical protein